MSHVLKMPKIEITRSDNPDFKVALVGKTNVGKSSLFNALLSKKYAIVSPTPGVTRDRKSANILYKDRIIEFTDTAGLEKISSGTPSRFIKELDRIQAGLASEMYEQMIMQSIESVKEADLVLFIVDGINGVDSEDMYFARIVRRLSENVICVTTKVDNKEPKADLNELYSVGFGEPMYTSSAHNKGIKQLLSEIHEQIPRIPEKDSNEELDDTPSEPVAEIPAEEKEDIIKIAIVGRPNAGKSTLLNAILNEFRVITGDYSGMTRDSISIMHNFGDQKIELVDTPGIRRRFSLTHKKKDNLELDSVNSSYRAIRLAQICILIIDATDPFVMKDVELAGKIIEEGRNIIFAINKWDLLEPDEKKDFKKHVMYKLPTMIPDISMPEFCFISALNKTGTGNMLKKCIKAYDLWNKRVQTATLNQWIRAAQAVRTPGFHGRKRINIKYATQIRTRPPTIKVFANHKLSKTYLRFLRNRFAEDFGLHSIPLRIVQ